MDDAVSACGYAESCITGSQDAFRVKRNRAVELERNTEIHMLDYARQRAIEALRGHRKAVLATSGPAGVQASEFPCEALGLNLYLLVPQTSDRLFNLEHDSTVTLLAPGWELRGKRRSSSKCAGSQAGSLATAGSAVVGARAASPLADFSFGGRKVGETSRPIDLGAQ